MEGTWRTRSSEPHVIRAIGYAVPNGGRIDHGTILGRSRPKGEGNGTMRVNGRTGRRLKVRG